jgi:myxalamid-type polyketide synthase MxaB
VLIHAAAGGVGQAAIQIARRAGAIIFATASRAKWDLLRSQGITNLYDSRSTAFATEILADTNGEGVDVVLNSLKGELATAGLQALKPQGCFLEIGLSAPVDPRCVPVQLGDVAPTVLRPLLQSIVDDVASGALAPLPREEFPLDQAPQAFHRMAQGKHTGKIVLAVPQAPRIQGTVLITGGLGALGLQVAEWLAAQGVSHLILTSRSQPTLPVLPHLNAEITVMPADISDEASVRDLFAELRRQGIHLNGIVHAAGVIQDGILTRQQWPALEAVFAPKIQGAWNLHRYAEHLDFFVCFSSFAALYGSPGQGAYAAANAFLDALMHHRRAQGLPGLSLNWGPWAGPGMASKHMHHGVTPLPPAKALAALGALLRSTEETQAAIVDADWQSIGTRAVPSLLRGLVSPPPIRTEQHDATLQARLQDVPTGRRRAVLAEFLQSHVATVLRLDTRQPLQERKGFFDYGLDSLMAVELRNRLQNATGAALPTTLLFDCPHLEALTNYFEAALLTPPAPEQEEEEDIEVLLARELALAEQEVRHG